MAGIKDAVSEPQPNVKVGVASRCAGGREVLLCMVDRGAGTGLGLRPDGTGLGLYMCWCLSGGALVHSCHGSLITVLTLIIRTVKNNYFDDRLALLESKLCIACDRFSLLERFWRHIHRLISE